MEVPVNMTEHPQQWWYVFDEQTRILVVDDDPILREFASVYLTTPMSTSRWRLTLDGSGSTGA